MMLLTQVLVVIAATGAMGSVQAQTPGNIFNLGTLDPSVQVKTDAFISGSFLDTFNFTVDSVNYMVTGTTVSTNVANLQLNPFDTVGTLLFTGVNLNANLTTGGVSGRPSGDVLVTPCDFT